MATWELLHVFLINNGRRADKNIENKTINTTFTKHVMYDHLTQSPFLPDHVSFLGLLSLYKDIASEEVLFSLPKFRIKKYAM